MISEDDHPSLLEKRELPDLTVGLLTSGTTLLCGDKLRQFWNCPGASWLLSATSLPTEGVRITTGGFVGNDSTKDSSFASGDLLREEVARASP